MTLREKAVNYLESIMDIRKDGFWGEKEILEVMEKIKKGLIKIN